MSSVSNSLSHASQSQRPRKVIVHVPRNHWQLFRLMGQWRQGECLPPCIKTMHSLVNRIAIWLVFCSVLFVGLAVVVVRGFRPCRVKRWLTIFGLMRWCLWKNTQLPLLLVDKGLRQEEHPAVKFLLQTWKF